MHVQDVVQDVPVQQVKNTQATARSENVVFFGLLAKR